MKAWMLAVAAVVVLASFSVLPRQASADTTTSYTYSSASGDYIGQGQSNSYTPANATFGDYGTIGMVTVWLTTSTENWHITLAAPLGMQLTPGSYTGAVNAEGRNGGIAPGIDVNGDGRACNHEYGSFTINEIGADLYGNVISLDATFSQQCETPTAPTLSGHVQYQVGTPIPTPPQSYPGSFSFVGGAGEYISQGASEYYGAPTTTLQMSGTPAGLEVAVIDGNHRWTIELMPPPGTQMSAHTVYPNAVNHSASGQPFLNVYGDGRACANAYGTFVVREIGTDATGNVTMLDASFSQSCESPSAIPLNGDIRFNAGDPGLQPSGVSVQVTPTAVAQGDPVTVTANATTANGAVPTGVVELLDDGRVLGTVPLDATGTASLTVPLFDGGANHVWAGYLGDWQFARATSGFVPVTVSVPPTPTTTVLTTPTGTVGRTSPVYFYASVSAANGNLPTGSVAFFNGSSELGTAPLDQHGDAEFSTTLPVGTYTISAVYSGDSTDAASTSNQVVVTVTKRR